MNPKKKIIDMLNNFAQCSALKNEIIWDLYLEDESEFLKQKISLLISGNEGVVTSAVIDKRQEIFKAVWDQRKYTNRDLFSTIIFVCVRKDETIPSENSTEFSCHPVFRIRKCCGESGVSKCCMVFIDEHGRVYPNWKAYINGNLLPKGIAVAPENGIYAFNNNGKLVIEKWYTPADSTGAKLLRAGDHVATFGCFVSLTAATISLPFLGPAALAATAVVGTGSAAYTMLRSANHISDRSKHGQSNSILNSEARASWSFLAGSMLGLGTFGVARNVQTAAKAGKKIGSTTKFFAKGLSVATTATIGASAAFNVCDMWTKWQNNEPIGRDLLQLSSHLFIFTHSVQNLTLLRNLKSLEHLPDGISRQMTLLVSSTPFRNSNQSESETVRILNDICAKANPNTIKDPLKLISESAGLNLDMIKLAAEYGSRFVDRIRNITTFKNLYLELAEQFCEMSIRFVMKIARELLDELLLKSVTTEELIRQIYMYIKKKFVDHGNDFLLTKEKEILEGIHKYFKSLKDNFVGNKKFKCPDCPGFYNICNL